jgi:hypothetical protein
MLLRIFAVTVLVIIFLSGVSLAAGKLIAFDRTKIAQFEDIDDLYVIAKLDKYAIGITENEIENVILESDTTALIIEFSTDIDQLWVNSKSSGKNRLGVLFESENYQLLRLSFIEALDF